MTENCVGDNAIREALSRQWSGSPVPIDSVCPLCQGIEVVKNEYTRKLEPCPTCSEPVRRSWLEHNCGLEGPMLHVRLSDWGPGQFNDDHLIQQRREAYKLIRDAIRSRAGLYTFHGLFGSGKSMALSVICNELREQLVETFYSPMEPILDHLRSMHARHEDTSTFWQRLLDIPVLALDEVTRFHATSWAEQRVFQLVDKRYQRRDSHLTLFAMNDNPEELASYLFSRMRDGKIIKLEGDMRSG